ncbi:MAG: hypothetical protein ACKO0N_04020 [Planctomycetota bacterium]
MEPQYLIDSTRRNLLRIQSGYSNSDFRKDRIKKPFLLHLIGDRRHDLQYRDQRILLERGVAVWGHIIQANRRLLDPKGGVAQPPAAIIYSTDHFFDARPDALSELASRIYELKGRAVTPEMQAFSDKLANEMVADMKLPIPLGFTDGRQCYYASLIICRRHLPMNFLASGLFPVLIAPQSTDTVMIAPQRYWDSGLVEAWRS